MPDPDPKVTVPSDEEIARDIAPMFIPADDGVFVHLTPDQLSAYVRQVRDRTRAATGTRITELEQQRNHTENAGMEILRKADEQSQRDRERIAELADLLEGVLNVMQLPEWDELLPDMERKARTALAKEPSEPRSV